MNRAAVSTRLRMLIALCVGIVAALPVLGAQAKVAEPTKPVKLDVPYVPTEDEVVEAMLKLAKVTSADYVFDLGCGDGRIVVAAAKKYKARAFGVDIDPQRIAESNENAKKAGVTDRVKFKLGDIMVTDVHEASVVTLFLLDSVNRKLRPRLLNQLNPGVRVVSHAFSMGDWKPEKVVRHPKAFAKVLYLWIVPARAGGTWTWKTKTAGGEVANTLKLEQEFQTVKGTLGSPGGAEVPIAEASLNGKTLRFTATPRIGGKEVKIAYQGTVEGDAIQGTQKWMTGPSAGTHPWAAKRDRVDIAGRWQIKALRHANADGTLSIQRKNGALRATYARDQARRKREAPVPDFCAWGASIRFELSSRGSSLIFCGTLAADAGEGTVSRTADGKATPWSAKRLAEK